MSGVRDTLQQHLSVVVPHVSVTYLIGYLAHQCPVSDLWPVTRAYRFVVHKVGFREQAVITESRFDNALVRETFDIG